MNTTALGFLVSDPSSKPMLASHSLDQLLWFVRNATLVVFSSLTTLNPTALEYALTAPSLVQSLTFYTITLLFVVFYMLSLFLNNNSTNRSALISFYSANVALLCAIFWFTSSNDLGGVRAGASLLSSGAFFFPLLSLLMVLGFWTLLIYNTEYVSPLDGYRRPFSGWYLHALPLYLCFMFATESNALLLIFCELLVTGLYMQSGEVTARQTGQGNTAAIVLIFAILSLVGCFGGIPASSCEAVADLLLSAWLALHSLQGGRIAGPNQPVILFFYNLVIAPIVLLCFTRVYSFHSQAASVCLLSLWVVLLVTRSVGEVSGYTPLRAYPRIHNIAMFEDAPEADEPEQLVGSVKWNSNLIVYLGGIVDLAYGLLAVQVAAATEQAYGLTAITVVAYAFFGSLGLYTAAVILHNFDSNSILDFRGVFLAIHQYQWCINYTFVLYLHLCTLLLASHVATLAYLIIVQTPPKLMLAALLITILPLLFFFFRFLQTWGELIPYWQDYYYTNWGDEYWSHTSPYLRDYIYWKPIQPDDFEEPSPFYLYLRKNATTSYALNLYHLISVICLLSTLGFLGALSLWLQLLLLNLTLAVVVYIAANNVVTEDISGHQAHLYDFTYFETLTHITCGLLLFIPIYYYYYFTWDSWFPNFLD